MASRAGSRRLKCTAAVATHLSHIIFGRHCYLCDAETPGSARAEPSGAFSPPCPCFLFHLVRKTRTRRGNDAKMSARPPRRVPEWQSSPCKQRPAMPLVISACMCFGRPSRVVNNLACGSQADIPSNATHELLYGSVLKWKHSHAQYKPFAS